MDIMQKMLDGALALIPTAVAIIGLIIVLFLARAFLQKQFGSAPGYRLRRQLVTLVISFAGLIAIILALPIGDTRQGQLLSLIGILFSAAIALSSATIMGNILAGFMLRIMRNFRAGDFIRVGDFFGRVSDRSLFHVEIQTEDRDLTTLSNLYLVINPVKVIQSSGTIVSAEISLGYDLSRETIKKLLLEAAEAANLQDPFVQVLDLGDFAVTYRVAGLLVEVKNLISTRSHLRELILDTIHRAGVEIVSPTFMNTRAIQPGMRFIPAEPVIPTPPAAVAAEPAPEEVAFDKADEAESIEKLQERYKSLAGEIEAVKERLKQATQDAEKKQLRSEIETLERQRASLGEYLKQREDKEKS